MSVPAYERIYDKIRRDILSGVYAFGARLPGKRSLAEQFGVSVITVAHALELLADEGYLAPRQRSGFYVAYHAGDAWQGSAAPLPGPSAAPLPAESSVPASSAPRIPPRASSVPGTLPARPAAPDPNSPPDPDSRPDPEAFPFSVLARTMRRLLSDGPEVLLRRSPNQGLPLLQASLSRYLSRSRNMSVSPDQIVVGAGSEYLYGLLADILGRDRIWAIESPSYEKIEQVYSARGIRLDPLPLGRDGLLSGPLRATEASVLHVSPYRSYPSNVTASASRRSEYLRWGDREDRLIIEDDFESEFCVRRKPMDTLFSQSSRQNVIYLNTFSRTLSPSLRVGYMVLPPALLPQYRERAGFYSCTVSTLEQCLLAALLDSGDFERHIRRVRRRLR